MISLSLFLIFKHIINVNSAAHITIWQHAAVSNGTVSSSDDLTGNTEANESSEFVKNYGEQVMVRDLSAETSGDRANADEQVFPLYLLCCLQMYFHPCCGPILQWIYHVFSAVLCMKTDLLFVLVHVSLFVKNYFADFNAE